MTAWDRHLIRAALCLRAEQWSEMGKLVRLAHTRRAREKLLEIMADYSDIDTRRRLMM